MPDSHLGVVLVRILMTEVCYRPEHSLRMGKIHYLIGRGCVQVDFLAGSPDTMVVYPQHMNDLA